MTIVIACPMCSQKVRAPEAVVGRQIKCPQCKNAFIAIDPNAAPTFDAAFTAAPQEPPATPTFFTPVDEFAPAPVPRGGGAFVDYLMMRRMVTPILIVILFYLGVVVQLLAAVVYLVMGLMTATARGGALLGIGMMLGAVIGTIASLIVWRISCEVLITLFRIHDHLREINERGKNSM